MDGVDGIAILSTEHGEVFRSLHYASTGSAVVGVVVGMDYGGIGGSCCHVLPLAISGSRCCLANNFRLSIVVEVINEELGVVCPSPDVLAEIDAPQLPSIKLVSVDDDVACISVVGVVVGIGWVPFDDELIFTVAVEVAGATVVRRVGEGLAVGCHASFGTVDGQSSVEVVPWLDFFCLLFLSSLVYHDAVGAGGSAACVGEVGYVEVVSHHLPIPHDGEGHLMVVVA